MVPFCPVWDRFWLTEEPYIIFFLQESWDITICSFPHPQMDLSAMSKHLSLEFYHHRFCSGMSAELRKELVDSEQVGSTKLHMVGTHERNCICFFSVALPVAVAGCDVVNHTLKPAYDHWLRELEQLPRDRAKFASRLYHAFPGSQHWPSPTDLE